MTPTTDPLRTPPRQPAGPGTAPKLPPDRSHIATEQRHPGTAQLHRLSVRACVRLMNRENRAVLKALHAAESAVAAFIEAVEPGFTHPRSPGRLIYLGAGTSGRLGVLDASEAPPTFQVPPDRIIGLIAGGDAALRRSSEGLEDDPDGALPDLRALRLTPRDAVLGIAAGGTTPYVLGALRLARRLQRRCVTGLLCCTPLQRRPPACDHLIVLPTGPEILTGSTRMKAGTATKLVLNTISTTLMVRSGRVYQNLMVDLRATNAKLRDRAARIISTLTGLDRADALAALDRAGGGVKTAVVMVRLGVEREEAERRLSRVHGRLGDVLDRPSTRRNTRARRAQA
jgi:N-acetylmuramic acid 6-phosphate etherase